MKPFRALAGAFLIGASTLMLAACVVPADTEHVAHAALTNQCTHAIRAVVAQFSNDFPSSDAASSVRLVDPGERVKYANPLSLPIEDKLYLWVVAPDAKTIGKPQEVELADLERETLPSGGIVFHITVSGVMCPE